MTAIAAASAIAPAQSFAWTRTAARPARAALAWLVIVAGVPPVMPIAAVKLALRARQELGRRKLRPAVDRRAAHVLAEHAIGETGVQVRELKEIVVRRHGLQIVADPEARRP